MALAIAGHLDERARCHRVLRDPTVAATADASEKLQALVQSFRDGDVDSFLSLIGTGAISPGRIQLTLDPYSFAANLACEPSDLHPDLIHIDAPLICKRRGVEMKIVAGDHAPEPDRTLVRALRKAHHWADMVKDGTSLTDIARAEGFSESYVRRLTPLATLSPRMQDAIVTGTQPIELTLETLVRGRLPFRFEDQERLAGFRN